MIPRNETTSANRSVEVFFDGDCPLCKREIALLRRWDRQGRIRFTDISDSSFDAAVAGVSYERLMAEVHGRLPDGSIISGVEVFRRLYSAVGLGALVTVSRWPGVSHLLELGYRVFAHHRLRLTGRCQAGECRAPKASSKPAACSE